MELSNEQYEQILRYAEGEMNPAEIKAFEAVLFHNTSIRAELEFYKEIRSLIASADQKIVNVTNAASERQTDNRVLGMIKHARTNWENSHKDDSGQEDHLPLKGKGAFERPFEEEPKVKRTFSSQWLIAAVLTGFVCISITFQYLRNKSGHQGIVYKNQVNSKVAADNKNLQSQKKNIADTNRSHVQSSRSDDGVVRTTLSIEKSKREKLFAKNFKLDDLPAQIPAPLEDPSALYKDRKPEKAILEYKNLLSDIKDAKNSDIEARGEDDEIDLIAFYAHYYLAQSYMSVSNMTKALEELGNAILKAPDKIWKDKVQWYTALAFLKTGQVHKAEILLKEVAGKEQANDYKQRAIKLINDLKKD